MYFWETNPARALHWAKVLRALQGNGGENIKRPYVVGAVISLGYCLDLTSATGIEFVRTSYHEFHLFVQKSGGKMPRNVGGKDLLRRYLDCAVITSTKLTRPGVCARLIRFARCLSRDNPYMRDRVSASIPTFRSASGISTTSRACSEFLQGRCDNRRIAATPGVASRAGAFRKVRAAEAASNLVEFAQPAILDSFRADRLGG